MACSETARLPKISAFFRCTVQLGATFALIIKDPTAVGICAYFETSGIVISQHMSERSRDFCLNPVPILLEWHHFQLISIHVFLQVAAQGHFEQNGIERCLILFCDLSLNQRLSH